MNQYDRMVSQLPYKVDAECKKKMTENKKLIYKYNKLSPSSSAKKLKLIKKILGKAGSNINIEQPFHCDYGKHIFVGENFYSNYNLTILDVAKVQIGDNVMCGPNVSIYTAGHPVHYETRNTLYEYGIEIYIEDNVWIGGNSIILPGVKIAKGSVIGAGSVVTKSIPANSIAAGNPCRVLRKITDEDKEFYFQKLKFDAAIK